MTTPAQIRDSINAAMGKDAVQFASDPRYEVEFIPTGVLPVDVLLDGGLARGRITEFYGPFSSLKSYIALKAIAAVQEEGGTAMLVDSEHSFDPVWAEACGVDVDALIIDHPNTAEEACDKTQIAIVSGVDLVVWDSVAAMQPAQHEGVQLSGKANIQPARLAAFMSVGLNRLNTVNSRTALLFINQTRSKVGVTFGSPETTPGGNALPFYASIRVKFSKAGRVTETRKMWDGDKMSDVRDVMFQKIRVELIKTKLSRPEREQWFQWNTKEASIDEVGYLIAIGIEHGAIKKRGNGWALGTATFRGQKTLREYVESNTKVKSRLRELARSAGSGVPRKSKASKSSAES